MITVPEMIDPLGSYPEYMRVVVSGYEQEYDGLSGERISFIPATLNTGIHQWEATSESKSSSADIPEGQDNH